MVNCCTDGVVPANLVVTRRRPMSSCSRRDFFKLPLALGATALFERDGAGAGRRVIDEFDPANIKLAHRVPARISDDDLLFLKQIGMRWARVEFGAEEEALPDSIRATQQRYARFGIQIYSSVHPAYRSLKFQLAHDGRDGEVAKVFVHYDGYHRAEQIAAGSRHWGLTFCIGTWSEGGDRMGKNVLEMNQDFGGRGKIFDVHFRNVSGPLPHFVETFPDDGYVD